jgi:hypothetical protein
MMDKTYPCPKPDKKSGQIPSLTGTLVKVTDKLEHFVEISDFEGDDNFDARELIIEARSAIEDWKKYSHP